MEIYKAEADLVGVGRLSWSRYLDVELPKGRGTNKHQEWEQEHWRDRFHYDDGKIVLPALSFKLALLSAMAGKKIPGRGMSTYTKPFTRAVLPDDAVVAIDRTVDDVKSEELWLPSDGKAGGGKRVKKIMPYVEGWSATLSWTVADEDITAEVFREALDEAGMLVGVGRFRPENRGLYGRWSVARFTWVEA